MNSQKKSDAGMLTHVGNSQNYRPRPRPRKQKPKYNSHEQRLLDVAVGRATKSIHANAPPKYYDFATGWSSPVTIPANTTSTFGVNVLCIDPSQGAGQAARVADTIRLKRLTAKIFLEYNFSSASLTQDIAQTIRTILYRWKVLTSLAAPTPGSIFQNVSSTGTASNFDFERKDNYDILFDQIDKVIGFADSTATIVIPTSHSLVMIVLDIDLGNSRALFDPGATTGSGLIYLGFGSDTSSGPAPLLRVVGRVYYENEV